MSEEAVVVSCPHCRRVYQLQADRQKLTRLNRTVMCGRCKRRFSLSKRLNEEPPPRSSKPPLEEQSKAWPDVVRAPARPGRRTLGGFPEAGAPSEPPVEAAEDSERRARAERTTPPPPARSTAPTDDPDDIDYTFVGKAAPIVSTGPEAIVDEVSWDGPAPAPEATVATAAETVAPREPPKWLDLVDPGVSSLTTERTPATEALEWLLADDRVVAAE